MIIKIKIEKRFTFASSAVAEALKYNCLYQSEESTWLIPANSSNNPPYTSANTRRAETYKLNKTIVRPNIKRLFFSLPFFPSLQQPPSAIVQVVNHTTTTF
jgi:hypothetical protein